jgi:hypothetical protein
MKNQIIKDMIQQMHEEIFEFFSILSEQDEFIQFLFYRRQILILDS